MKSSPAARYLHKGFTLIELLVVIAIIAILLGMLMVVLGPALTKGKIAKTSATIDLLSKALDQYHFTWHCYPIKSGGSGVLVDNGGGSFNPGFYQMVCAPVGSKANGSEDNSALIKLLIATGDLQVKQSDLRNGQLVDAWGTPFVVRFLETTVIRPGGAVPVEKYFIWSYGPDGKNQVQAGTSYSNLGLPVYDNVEAGAMQGTPPPGRDDVLSW